MTQALTGTHRPLQGANQSAMVAVARKSGISPLRQFAEIWRLGRGAGRIAVGEYYGFQLWRRDLTDKRNFLGERGSLALNLRLAPPEVCHMRNFLGDKLAFTLFAQGLGLPTTETLAAYHPTRSFGALARLRGAAEIAPLPLFGKPIRGQQARGALRIEAIEAEMAVLPQGRVALRQDGRRNRRRGRGGLSLPDPGRRRPRDPALTGTDTVSTLRVVTVNRTGQPELLYSCWKLPSDKAVSDNFWQEAA